MDDSHAVILYLRLSNGQFGSEEERDAIHRMTDRLVQAILANDVGELDGDEFGGNECVVYMYGPDAGKLFSAIQPVLKDWPALVGGYAIKRFGPPGAPFERVDFSLG
jgi:hypothetical protein